MAFEKDLPKPDDYLISYKMLRRTVGWLGLILPAALFLGDRMIFHEPKLRESISAYYYSGMGGVFVGILFAIAMFMFAYRGPNTADNIAGGVACLFAVGVALFPTTPLIDQPSATEILIGKVHVVMAAGLFATLAFFCLFLFTKTDKKNPGKMKKVRNGFYYFFGGVMVLCLIMIASEAFVPTDTRNRLVFEYNSPIFWPDTAAIMTFRSSL